MVCLDPCDQSSDGVDIATPEFLTVSLCLYGGGAAATKDIDHGLDVYALFFGISQCLGRDEGREFLPDSCEFLWIGSSLVSP